MGGILRILLILIAVVAIAAGVATFALPGTAAKSETVDIARPPPSVFARLASAPANAPLGDGVTQTVTQAANNVVTADLAFPEGAKGRAVYTISPAEGGGSHVLVRIESPLALNPIDRVQGLTGAPAAPFLAAAVASVTSDLNALPTAAFTGLSYEVVQVTAQPFLYVESAVPQDAAAIKEAVAQSLVLVRPIMSRYSLAAAGPPIAVETAWENGQYAFQAGLPFTGTPPRILVGVRAGQTPSGQAIRVRYQGPEENVLATYDQMEALIAAGRLTLGHSFEIYHDDPTQGGGSVDREIYYLVTGDVSHLPPSAPAPPQVAVAPLVAPAPASAPATAPTP